MKLVSAAKMAKAQAAITSSRHYASELEATIKTISALVQNYSNKLLEPSKGEETLVLILSANKGLCGGFNAQLGKEVRRFIGEQEGAVKVSFIGKKLRDLFQVSLMRSLFIHLIKMKVTMPI